jgi:hypothetical protein
LTIVSDCNEAYVVEKNRGVCVSGCNFAKKEVDNIMEVTFCFFSSKIII